MRTSRQTLILATALCALAIPAASASAADVSVTPAGPVTEGSGGLGGTANFTVTVTQANGEGVATYGYETTDGAAHAGDDYTFASGGGSVPACANALGCQTQIPVAVTLVGDNIDEANEGFGLKATSGMSAANGSATIVDDDDPPLLEVDGDKVTEGNAGQTDAKVEFELKAPSGQNVTVHWETSDRSAFSPSDYQQRSGTVTFQPGQTEKSVHIPVFGDTTVEGDEEFAVHAFNAQHATLDDDGAKVTIVNDDVPPPPPPPPANQGSSGQPGSPTPIVVTLPGTQQHQVAAGQAQALAPHAPADTLAPLMSVVWRGLSESRTVGIKVGCPAGETLCHGTLVLRAGGHELGRRGFTLDGGRSRTLSLHLSRRALRRALHSGALVARITARDLAGNRSLRTRTFVL